MANHIAAAAIRRSADEIAAESRQDARYALHHLREIIPGVLDYPGDQLPSGARAALKAALRGIAENI